MADRFDVSVIVATFNRCDRLEQCLRALRNQDFDLARYEIVVSDDGSNDGTSEMMRTYPRKKPSLMYCPHANMGRATNRNIGIRNSSGKILLFIDDDVIATENLIKEHYRSQNSDNTGKLVVLGYTPFSKNVENTPIIRYWQKVWENVYKRASNHTSLTPYNLSGLFISNNISIRRDYIETVGLFDDDFSNYSYEDSELGYRLMKNGMIFGYNPSAVAYHEFRISLETSYRQSQQAGFSAVIFYHKHPELRNELDIGCAYKKDYSFWRRTASKILINKMTISVLECAIKTMHSILPSKIEFILLQTIQWYYYLIGIRKGLKVSEHDGLRKIK